jgi:ABC-type transporter Mla subunit MlaD
MAGTGHTQWERDGILGLLGLGVVVWLVLWLTRGRQP